MAYTKAKLLVTDQIGKINIPHLFFNFWGLILDMSILHFPPDSNPKSPPYFLFPFGHAQAQDNGVN